MNQWAMMSKRFHEWASPLRPCAEDVEMFKSQLHTGDKTLLLGVTSELLPLATVTVDNDPIVIQNHSANAMLADWGNLPFDGEFDTCIGDGCLTVFQGSAENFFQQIRKVLRPKGRLVLRVFIAPERKEPLSSVLQQKEKIGFHAFKWKVAHSLANPYVPVQDIYRHIHPLWDHPTLDVYRDSKLVYYFPKLSELPPWTHIQFGSYELRERCPVITWHVC